MCIRDSCRALRKNSDGVYDSNEQEGRPKKELVHLLLALSMFRRNGIWRSRSAERGSKEWRTNYSSRHSRRIWDYRFKRRHGCSQAQLQEVYHPFFLAVLLKDLHHNGDAFLEDHTGLRWLEQWDEDRLVYLSLIHIWRCRRSTLCRSRWSPYH